MKRTHRIAAIAFRDVRRFAALVGERSAQIDRAKVARSMPSFRPLTAAETEVYLGGELLEALSGAAPCASHTYTSHR